MWGLFVWRPCLTARLMLAHSCARAAGISAASTPRWATRGRQKGRPGEIALPRGNWKSRGGPGAIASLRDNAVGDLLYGLQPVLGALRAGRRSLHRLFVKPEDEVVLHARGRDRAERAERAEIRRLALDRGIAVMELPPRDLNILVANRPHQGVVLDCQPRSLESLDQLPDVAGSASPWPLCVALDTVQDPQNLGAVLRSALFFGVHSVVLSRRFSAPLSPAVSKASAGALEYLTVHGVDSLPDFLSRCRRTGWHVVGTALAPDALPAASFRLSAPTVLVFGNEGEGLRPAVRAECAALLRVDGQPGAAVDCLNISVTAGALLFRLLGRESAS